MHTLDNKMTRNYIKRLSDLTALQEDQLSKKVLKTTHPDVDINYVENVVNINLMYVQYSLVFVTAVILRKEKFVEYQISKLKKWHFYISVSFSLHILMLVAESLD